MGILMLNFVGQCGPILGTRVFPDNSAPRYIKGQAICAAFMLFVTFLALSLRVLLMWENRHLDKQYGTQAARAAQRVDPKGEPVTGEENYGPEFRFVL
jgi:retrograde regulation protein 2